MQVNVPMGKIINLYSVESEIDTNGFTLVAHWYDVPLNMHEVLGSSPGVIYTFYTRIYRFVSQCTNIYWYIKLGLPS